MSSPSDHTDEEIPVDERLVAPGTRYEIDDGKLVYVPPADEPHGVGHGALGALLRAHRAPDYSVAIDMLTRTSRESDFAPDASVYPTARHPVTGGRQLEELAFELLSATRLSTAASKAAQLAARGVRRIFGIELGKRRVVEWSAALGTWSILATDAPIVDRALAVPLPLSALVDAANADDAVVNAYRARRHPAFLAEREEGREEGREQGREQGREEGREQGREDGVRALLRAQLEARFGPLDDASMHVLARAGRDALTGIARRVLTATTLDEALRDI